MMTLGRTSPITQIADHLEVATCTLLVHPPSMHQAFPVMRPPPAANLITPIIFLPYPVRVGQPSTAPVQTLFSPDNIPRFLHQNHPFCKSVSSYRRCRVHSVLLIMTVLNFYIEPAFSLENPCVHETGHIFVLRAAAESLPPHFEPYLAVNGCRWETCCRQAAFRIVVFGEHPHGPRSRHLCIRSQGM